jgi:adenylosuccinate lyase
MKIMDQKIVNWLNIPMLSRTHGQPASPSILGKEILVFRTRLNKQLDQLKEYNYTTKFGGAIGNFNSHYAAYPHLDWLKFADDFIDSMGLSRNQYTTQIDNYDNYSEIFDILKRISVILVDFCRDIWLYISQDYFIQLKIEEEVGSSAMPHKINPIHFENAEGNLMMAITLFEFMSRKLPVSRLQRDLTDSTVLRNLGTCYGHLLIGLESIISGMKRIEVNKTEIQKDLQKNKIVLAEAVQTILRRERIENSYLLIKEMTRGGKDLDLDEMVVLLQEKGIQISEAGKSQIYNLDVHSYVGRF